MWQPSHGIVFGTSKAAAASRSMNTTIAADTRQELSFHSKLDDELNGSSPGAVIPPAIGSLSIHDAAESCTSACQPTDESIIEDPEQDELPASTIPFKMPEEMFRGAKNAVPGSPESFWSHALYRGPEVDGVQPRVKIHYCRSKSTTQSVLEQYFMDKNILGFDIEWKMDTYKIGGIKRNVSLIQLASEDRIGLFHISLYAGDTVDSLVAPALKAIMEDPSITKVGVAIKADCTRLRKFLNIDARGIFELSHLYRLVKFSSSKDYQLINKRLVSLATQVQEYLHLPLFKGEVRGSDWSQALGMDQIVYAASDAYAGVHLFDTLEIKRNALNPTPPRPYHAEENKPIRLAEGVEIPTDEDIEPEELDITTATRKYTKLSSSYLASAAETIELDPEFDLHTPNVPSASSNTSSSATRSKSATKAAVPKHPLVIAGESLSVEYRSSRPKTRASPASLRCYFIWYHNPNLSLQDIAALLRDMPLQTATVVNYILESVKLEKLGFEKERLATVLKMLPKEIATSRYRALAKACGMTE
jgi:hypothetical protein